MITGTPTWLTQLAARQKQAIYLLCFGGLNTCIISKTGEIVSGLAINPSSCPAGSKLAVLWPTTATLAGIVGANYGTARADGKSASGVVGKAESYLSSSTPSMNFAGWSLPPGVAASKVTKIWGALSFSYQPGVIEAGIGYANLYLSDSVFGVVSSGPGLPSPLSQVVVNLISPTLGRPDPTAIAAIISGSSGEGHVDANLTFPTCTGSGSPPNCNCIEPCAQMTILGIAFVICYLP